MKIAVKNTIVLFWILLALLLPVSCQKEAAFAPPGAPEAGQELVVEETLLEPVASPRPTQALVTFMSGDVFWSAGDEWVELEIGAFLEQDNALKTGEGSYCELQFGALGVIRIEADTQILLEDLILDPGQADVGVKVALGSVLNKVNKLKGGDRYAVKSAAAVCGVRGTEFGVSVDAAGETRLAVKEGQVSVFPANVDVQVLMETIEDQDDTLVAVVEKIDDAAPLVEQNEEVLITLESLAETEEAVQAIEMTLTTIAAAGNVAGADLTVLTKQVEAASTLAVASVEQPQQISPESSEQLAKIDMITLVEIPMAPAAVAPAAAAQVETSAPPAEGAAAAPAAETSPAPPPLQLEKIAFRVIPREAEILVNTEPVGWGKFSGLFAHGDTLNVLIRSEGYIEHSFTVAVSPAGGTLYDIQLEKEPPPTEAFAFQVIPADAEIFLDGERLAAGSYSGDFEQGRQLSFSFARENYQPQTVAIAVTAGSGKLYRIELAEILRIVTVNAVPSDARIFLNGQPVARGSFSGDFPISENLSFRFESEGYQAQSLSVPAREANQPYLVRLEKLPVAAAAAPAVAAAPAATPAPAAAPAAAPALAAPAARPAQTARPSPAPAADTRTRSITLTTVPRDAEIILDGKTVATGSFTMAYPLDRTLAFQIRRAGFKPRIVTLEAGEAVSAPIQVTLSRLALVNRSEVSEAPLAGSLIVSAERIYAADRLGTVYALNRQGRTLWTASTRNQNNENASPVLIDGNLFFSGANEFVILNAATGREYARLELERAHSHLFGRHAVPFGQYALFPTNGSVRLIERFGAETRRDLPVPGGSRMTPALYQDKIHTVNQEGVYLVIDPTSGAVETSIKTGAVQPTAASIFFYEGRAYFSGRKGHIVCIDLAFRRVVWERDLPVVRERGVFHDLEVGEAGVFAYSLPQRTVYGLSLAEGDPLFTPIRNAGSPPLYAEAEGRLYVGLGEAQLALFDTRGVLLKKIGVGSRITTRPVLRDGRLFVGTDQGEVLEIDPDGVE